MCIEEIMIEVRRNHFQESIEIGAMTTQRLELLTNQLINCIINMNINATDEDRTKEQYIRLLEVLEGYLRAQD